MTANPINSTLTDRYQTTIPEAVRKQLGLNKRDQVEYTIGADGSVVIRRAQDRHQDPALRPFLALLERDLSHSPSRLQPLEDQRARLQHLTRGAEFDLDAQLDPADE
jgi:antitoxin PrlF